jgi:multidrug resistance efflux pump
VLPQHENDRSDKQFYSVEKRGFGMKKKKIIPVILLLAVLIGGGAAYYFLVYSAGFITTDNAKVTAKMYSIYPSSAGTLLEWDIRNGDYVDEGEVLGRTQSLPYITSPIKGTVVQDNAQQNQTVSAATQLAVIADTDNLYIGVNVEETRITQVAIGQKADVKIDAYPGRTFEGTVTEIGSTTQTYFSAASSFTTSGTYTKVTQNIPVKVEIENPDGLPLIFGMNATVKFYVK